LEMERLREVSETLPKIYLARHGETEWSITGQHTGLTDLPLTAQGERNARALGARLKDLCVATVLTSPLQRARRTCELAGLGMNAQVDPDLGEWNYGDYEGRRTADIRMEHPGWSLFRDGCPHGESVRDVAARADRVIARLRATKGDVLVFGHGHCLSVIGARWVGLPVVKACVLLLTTGSLSIVGYDHTAEEPVVRLWNDDRHVALKA